MNNYIQINIEINNPQQSEMLIAQLSQSGFDGFEENENLLSAYIKEDAFNEADLREIIDQHQLKFSRSLIAQKNWNEEWEKNFEPVTIDDFVTIRAGFHPPSVNVEHEIVITPKMSFGTGHHATTFMMMQQMRSINFKDKLVFDFGTGTGILSILAEKLGATKVVAIDNDEWSINNAIENVETNHCKKILLNLSNKPIQKQQFDIVLANINKNVILQYLQVLKDALLPNGHLLVSGLLFNDEADILFTANKLQLKHIITTVRDKWILMWFMYN